MNRRLKKIWICSDVWMDILPSFDRPQLGLKMALLSPRFDVLVDAHFDGKTELTLWSPITIRMDIEMPKLFVDGKFEGFPVPDHPLPNKIRFRCLVIMYIDHFIIEFLRSIQQILDRSGTKLALSVQSFENDGAKPIWDIFVRQIWPIFAPNIRHLQFTGPDFLDNLLRLASPTMLITDLDHQLNSIDSHGLCPEGIADHFPNATTTTSAGHVLSKWLHTPTKKGQPKRLYCSDHSYPKKLEWINNFKEAFLRAITTASSVSYTIHFHSAVPTPSIVPFELVNERTNEKLALMKQEEADYWILKRCPISEKAAAVQRKNKDENSEDNNNLNNVRFDLICGNDLFF